MNSLSGTSNLPSKPVYYYTDTSSSSCDYCQPDSSSDSQDYDVLYCDEPFLQFAYNDHKIRLFTCLTSLVF